MSTPRQRKRNRRPFVRVYMDKKIAKLLPKSAPPFTSSGCNTLTFSIALVRPKGMK